MTHVRFIAWLCLLITLCMVVSAPGFSETVVSQHSIKQSYEGMLKAFDNGLYDIAYDMAKDIYDENPHYLGIDSYYHYLLALLEYMPNGQYNEAYKEFNLLSISGFAKSVGYAAYALGLDYEQHQMYDDACAAYRTAIQNDVGEAQEHIRACQTAAQNAYEEADAQAQQGNYKVAGDIFAVITSFFPDALQKAQENYYKAADQLTKAGKYDEAIDLFTQLGDYSDSRERIIEIEHIIPGPKPPTLRLRLESADTTSLVLAWENELNIQEFNVSYEPVGMKSLAKTIQVSTPSCTITGLIPNTEYAVSVAAIGRSELEEGNYFTQQALSASNDNYPNDLRSVYLCSYQSTLKGIGLSNLFSTNMYNDLVESGMNPLTRKPSQSNDRYFVYATFYRYERIPQTLELTYVLRLNGKYSNAVTFTAECTNESFPFFPVDVTDLMDSFWGNFESAGESIDVDAYLDGQYLCTSTVRIGK